MNEFELWKPAVGLPDYYEVSTAGNARIREGEGQYKPLRQGTSDGYKYIYYKGKAYEMGRLVATTFIPNPDPSKYTTVDHINGKKSCNYANNLQWVTRSQNIANANRLGLNSKVPLIYCVETQEVFAGPGCAGLWFNLPPRIIQEAIAENRACFGLHFQIVPRDTVDLRYVKHISLYDVREWSKTLDHPIDIREYFSGQDKLK